MNRNKVLQLLLYMLGIMLLLGALCPVLYFQWHSSEAPTLAAISGAFKLRDKKVPYVEIVPGIYMFRMTDIQYQKGKGVILPCNPDLASQGWSYREQMGAGLSYERGKHDLHVLYTTCGPDYAIATLAQNPTNGQSYNHKRPSNLFGI